MVALLVYGDICCGWSVVGERGVVCLCVWALFSGGVLLLSVCGGVWGRFGVVGQLWGGLWGVWCAGAFGVVLRCGRAFRSVV